MSEKQVQAQHTQDQGPPETPTLTEDDNKGQMSDDESQWDLVTEHFTHLSFSLLQKD